MSFFFDVWTPNGFVLASDVKLTNDPDSAYMHKIILAPERCKVTFPKSVDVLLRSSSRAFSFFFCFFFSFSL